MNLFVKTPTIVPLVLKSCTWNKSRQEKKIYLTFDDGPIPEVTDFVLETLKKYKIQGTFFCIGNNITLHKEIFERIKKDKHRIGNHTMHHANGWKTKTADYYKEVEECQKIVQSKLFRPPYGKLKIPQIKFISKSYEIIMWDVLSYDWVQTVKPKDVLKNVNDNATNGSIVVFHDSIKASKNLQYALPRFIETKLNEGFEFGAL
ncbi:MAG: polysaccharide deacetylase family protein [Bacteroidota bacterium]